MTKEEAIEIINNYFFYTVLPRINRKVVNQRKLEEAIKMAIEALKQPEQKKGKWKVDWDWGIATCTNCNHDLDADIGYLLGSEMKYCPLCGAEMEGE